MSEKYPTPEIVGGKWIADLRRWGFGWHYVLGTALELNEIGAVHAAYSKLDELRRARLAEPGAQLDLPAGAPTSFAGALDEWEARKQYDTDGGRVYGQKYAQLVRRELGAYELAVFSGLVGEDRLLAYLKSISGLGARTIRNRFSVVSQVLRFAHRRHWIAAVPLMPKMPARPQARHEWIDEPTFRAVRAAIHLVFGTQRGGVQLALGETPEGWTERRRVYLSWAFYTGAHNRDCDLLDDSHVSMDMGVYRRRNTKSAEHVADETFPMPEPLIDDLRRLLETLGREAWWCGEMIGGGEWKHADKFLARAQRELKVPGARLNMRVLRRSFIREMARRGLSERRIGDYVGHADTSNMIHEVYLIAPKPPGHEVSLWTRAPLRGAPRTPNTVARVVQLRKVEGGDDDQA